MPDTIGSKPIRFGRQVGTILTPKIDETKYGKSFYTFGKTFFIDNTLHLNNRQYQRVGLFYYKFERYCIQHKIAYNKKELKRYRKMALASGFIYGLACFGFMPVAIDAEIYARKSGNYNWPDMYFKSPLAPLLWALPVAEGIAAAKLRSAAERRLRDSLFCHPDSIK
ncbi:MAG: hypothetical protein IT236_04580 [Bacteroidia bacterium]|nr:hypothetical protein [Bacteroidia bacterium]